MSMWGEGTGSGDRNTISLWSKEQGEREQEGRGRHAMSLWGEGTGGGDRNTISLWGEGQGAREQGDRGRHDISLWGEGTGDRDRGGRKGRVGPPAEAEVKEELSLKWNAPCQLFC